MRFLILVSLLLSAVTIHSKAQTQEVKQLMLNVEKLSQLKNILADMKKGYQVVSTGYNAIKDVSQGNFKLHQVFLDGMMIVSPEVKKYQRVADILICQKDIIREYKSAFTRFKSSDNFNDQEIGYLSQVYKQLLSQCVDNVSDLMTVITSNKLRMTDDERLQAIDRIYLDTQDKIEFLKDFNNEASVLNIQRTKEKADVKTTQNLFLIKP